MNLNCDLPLVLRLGGDLESCRTFGQSRRIRAWMAAAARPKMRAKKGPVVVDRALEVLGEDA